MDRRRRRGNAKLSAPKDPWLPHAPRGLLQPISHSNQESRYAVRTRIQLGDLIRQRFGVRYHNHHVPRLLHQLGFSVQRPRKRLARADKEAQERWLKKRLPAITKSPLAAAV